MIKTGKSYTLDFENFKKNEWENKRRFRITDFYPFRNGKKVKIIKADFRDWGTYLVIAGNKKIFVYSRHYFYFHEYNSGIQEEMNL